MHRGLHHGLGAVARGAAGSLAMIAAILAWNASMHRDVDGRVLMERQVASMRRRIGDLTAQIQSLGFEPVDSWEGGEGEGEGEEEEDEEEDEGEEGEDEEDEDGEDHDSNDQQGYEDDDGA